MRGALHHAPHDGQSPRRLHEKRQQLLMRAYSAAEIECWRICSSHRGGVQTRMLSSKGSDVTVKLSGNRVDRLILMCTDR
jgi:hypothetical protein